VTSGVTGDPAGPVGVRILLDQWGAEGLTEDQAGVAMLRDLKLL